MRSDGGRERRPFDVTGIVLAGGRSSRFGRDKLKEPYRGAPLLHHAVLRLAEVCADVIVVVGPEGPRPDLPASSVVRVVRDAQEGLGPLAGVSAGLAESRTELALVVAGDMPRLSPAVLAAMLRAVEDEPSGRSEVEAVALRDAGSIRPLPLVVRAAAARKAARLLLQGGDRSLTSLVTALRARVLEEATWLPLDPERATMRDIDVPEDLKG